MGGGQWMLPPTRFQARLADYLAAEEQQIEIQSARGVGFASHATVPRFQRLQLPEQFAW